MDQKPVIVSTRSRRPTEGLITRRCIGSVRPSSFDWSEPSGIHPPCDDRRVQDDMRPVGDTCALPADAAVRPYRGT